ncbi:hypothetical protein Kpol_1013p23 [Vanderwaltozyma polyspora DSM 70294]|uniref:NADP-dependent oxidoreductase domain-containing protein n=1 Tax=Vanderwaltozyma polyspora (strain ATCC 22028 / DSM 70294 / BCRC 21397 / CBS 2163 / NBRC 10782 / NRRL Y-8283 / UCD 57-17) TaxID=436907 RepID=A7TH71_VANPO|nr:uncharacterized protein Kpol_1013p23 [Vanderwaltozyma polyspora DSM 70294]EDO18352.1 hypothetical protein Kpol_1013p23 [Vanderwaltozyma polyspora DSM 70294]
MSFLPDLILGGATFNTQYNDDPSSIPIADILRTAFKNGINAIDSSPYYGPSEILLGNALFELKDEFSRDQYKICTKVGRIGMNEFDYSKENVRHSVQRSCERFHTSYLDLVYLHDVEFTTVDESIEACMELKKLKDEGIIRNFGLSGYPLDYIYKLVYHLTTNYKEEIGNLDVVLSYCNLNLQNTMLNEYYQKLMNCNLKTICNASILSMSLLRSNETRSFHPCSKELREAADRSSEYCKSNGVELADLATRYALSQWYGKGPTVLGVSSVKELEHSLNSYKKVKKQNGLLDESDNKMIEHIQRNIFGEHLNETWESGIEHTHI